MPQKDSRGQRGRGTCPPEVTVWSGVGTGLPEGPTAARSIVLPPRSQAVLFPSPPASPRPHHSRRGDGAVALLTSGVPDLCLDGLAVHLDAAGGELHSNGALALQVELVAGETGQQVAFPHA